jgi:hypothetical protein
MKIRRSSLLFKWAYLFEPHNAPYRGVSICPFFWRVVLFSPLKILIPLGTIALLGYGVIFATGAVLTVVGLAVGIMAAIAALFWLFDDSRINPGLVVAFYRARKENLCPTIKLEE